MKLIIYFYCICKLPILQSEYLPKNMTILRFFCHAKADMIESEKIKRKGIKERRMRDVIVSNSECIYGETAIFLPGSRVSLWKLSKSDCTFKSCRSCRNLWHHQISEKTTFNHINLILVSLIHLWYNSDKEIPAGCEKGLENRKYE